MLRGSRKHIWQKYFAWIVYALTGLAIASQLGGHYGGLALLVHFRFHLGVVAGIGLLLALWGQDGKSILLSLLCLALTLPSLWPLYVKRKTVEPVDGRGLFIISANLLRDNAQKDSALRYLEQSHSDLLILTELTEDWRRRLKSLDSKYPFRVGLSREDYHGILLLSRYPLHRAELWWPAGFDCPAVYAEVQWAKDTFSLVGLHPPAPPRRRKTRIRDLQFQALGNRLEGVKHPLLVLGDFNLTSFHPTYEDFQQRLNLLDTRIGQGRQASWPAWAGPLGLCLDHALVSPHWTLVHREVGPFIGSDHLPVELELQLK